MYKNAFDQGYLDVLTKLGFYTKSAATMPPLPPHASPSQMSVSPEVYARNRQRTVDAQQAAGNYPGDDSPDRMAWLGRARTHMNASEPKRASFAPPRGPMRGLGNKIMTESPIQKWVDKFSKKGPNPMQRVSGNI